MTTQREMAMAHIAQQQVIDVLRSIGEVDLGEPPEQCMTVRRSAITAMVGLASCRTAACVWCRRSMMHGWWNGMCHWSAERLGRAL